MTDIWSVVFWICGYSIYSKRSKKVSRVRQNSVTLFVSIELVLVVLVFATLQSWEGAKERNRNFIQDVLYILAEDLMLKVFPN